MTTEVTNPDIFGMSDEDFAKLGGNPPAVVEAPAKTPEELAAEEQARKEEEARLAQEEADRVAAEAAAKVETAATTSQEVENGGNVTPNTEVENKTEVKVDANTTPPAAAVAGKEGEQKVDATSAAAKTESPQDFEKLYKQITAPFKANGKQIEIRTPEEAIQLMQMGANYTRKMQELQPQRKLIMMLEANGLLDEGKLSYLIDLDKKNPEAIKKLIKDSGTDPLSIDVEQDHKYQAGAHIVTDDAANFQSVLDSIQSTEGGNETLQVINSEWDQASKEALWKDPNVMTTIHEHRANGVYKVVADEVNRLRTLGHIPANVSFVQAYHAVGAELTKQGAFTNMVKAPAHQAQPVAVQAATVKPTVKNSDAASAAAATRSTSKKAEVFKNPLEMSDEDFLKMQAPR